MSKTLYVGNLPHATDEDQLRELFAAEGREVGAVKVCRKEGKSRGFGFVEMASEDEANAAMVALHGTDLDGRQIKVSEASRDKRNARPGSHEDDYGRDGGRFGSRGGSGGKRGRR